MEIRKIFVVLAVFLMIAFSISGQVNVERYRRKSAGDGAAGDISLSALLIRGNTDVVNLDSSAGIFYRTGKYRFLLKGMLSFGEKNNDKYINNGFIHIRGVREITGNLSGEVFSQGEFDEFILLKRRTLAGAGFRFRMIGGEKILLYTGTGLMVEKEVFSERDGRVLKENTLYLKTTNYLSMAWDINPSAGAELVIYWQAPISRFSGYRFLTDLSLKFKLSAVFTFFTALNHRYDNDPPETIKKYDLTLKSGIRIQF